jgi:hypothetical protein
MRARWASEGAWGFLKERGSTADGASTLHDWRVLLFQCPRSLSYKLSHETRVIFDHDLNLNVRFRGKADMACALANQILFTWPSRILVAHPLVMSIVTPPAGSSNRTNANQNTIRRQSCAVRSRSTPPGWSKVRLNPEALLAAGDSRQPSLSVCRALIVGRKWDQPKFLEEDMRNTFLTLASGSKAHYDGLWSDFPADYNGAVSKKSDLIGSRC